MKYKPMPRRGNVSPDAALIQAMYTLDAASQAAEKTDDIEGLLKAATMWVKVSEALDAYASGQKIEVEEIFKDPGFKTGFQKAEETDA
jgi:hypothetical protein